MSFCPISPPRERAKRRQWTNERLLWVRRMNVWIIFHSMNFNKLLSYIFLLGDGVTLSPLSSPFLLFISFPYRCTDGWVLLVLFSLNVFVIARVSFVFLLLLLVGLAWYGLAWCLWLCVSNLTNTHSHFTKPNLTCLLIPGLWSNYNKNSNDKNNRSVYSHGIIMIFPVSVCTSVWVCVSMCWYGVHHSSYKQVHAQ